MSGRQKNRQNDNEQMSITQKNSELLALLGQLADDDKYVQKDKKNEIQLLCKIYSDGFRHSFGKISAKIQSILEEDNAKGECLLQNFQLLEEAIEEQADKKELPAGISGKVKNLYEHLNLEVGRYNLMTMEIEKRIQRMQGAGGLSGVSSETFHNKIQEIDKKVEGVDKKAYEVTRELEKVDGKLERNSMSSITTLTIFSAVILAFTGSVTFASGVFSGMSHVSSYRIVFVAAMVGEVVFNLIFMLLFVIGKLVGKNTCCQCQYYSEDAENENINICGTGWCSKKRHIPNAGCVMLHKYPYILFVNGVLGTIMYYDLVLFFINHPYYISFIRITSLKRWFLLFLPVIASIVVAVGYQIKKYVLYCRTVTAVSLVLAEEYYDEPAANGFMNIFSKVVETVRRVFMAQSKKRAEIEDILSRMPLGTKKEMFEYVIKELNRSSRLKLIKGSKNFLVISYDEDKYNRDQLEKTVNDILDDYVHEPVEDIDSADVIDAE